MTADLVAEVTSLRVQVAALREEVAEARLAAECQSSAIEGLRVMLHEARAASRRPAGLDGRRLGYAANSG